MAFLSSFLTYLLIFIILVGVAILGVFIGKALRKRKDAKDALKAAEATQVVEGVNNNDNEG